MNVCFHTSTVRCDNCMNAEERASISNYKYVTNTTAEDRIISDHLFELMETPEEDTLDTAIERIIYDPNEGETVLSLLNLIKAQRQSDLKKISFHAGIDIKTLEGYLESKVTE